MILKAYLDGKELTGHIPETWDDLTVKQYIALTDASTNVEMLSSLTGIDYWWFENTNIDLSSYIMHLDKLIKSIPDPGEVKKKVKAFEIMGKRVAPKDISDLTWLQKDMIKALLLNEEDFVKMLPRCFAIWVTPTIYGSFMSNKVEAVEREINSLKAKEVYPWVVFFFKKLQTEKINLLASLSQYP